MLRKNWFVFVLLFFYLLFLCKDSILGFLDSSSNLPQFLMDTKTQYYQSEYQEMQKLLEIPSGDYSITYSKVLLRDIYHFYDEIVIGKGYSDGIQVQDLVVSELGVVGVIKEVQKHSSIVELLTSPDLQLSVKINQSYGILTCVDQKIAVKNIKLDQEIQEGDLVYTSGLTSVVGDILVGIVKKVNTDSLELEYLLEVESISNLQTISYVTVLGWESAS